MVKTPRAHNSTHPIRTVNEPVPVKVQIGRDRKPIGVISDGQWRGVEAVKDVWKVQEGWWTGKEAARLYFELHMKDGSHVAVFQDLMTKKWYSQRA